MRALRIATALSAALALGTSAAPSPPASGNVGVSIALVRTSFDLLDSVSIAVVVHNPGNAVRTVHFAQPQEYSIEILDPNGVVLWSMLPQPPPHGVIYPGHQRTFITGPTTIVVRDWSGMTSDNWCPTPGKYKVRAKLLLAGATVPEATATITFLPPLPPGSLSALHLGEEVTLGGKLDSLRGTISDDKGSAPLSRRVLGAPADFPIVLRGYAFDHRDGTRTFTATRWAPLGAPAPVQTIPPRSPIVLPSPTPIAPPP